MENRQDIANELNSISPFWATISRKHPYTVPAGYFESMPQQVYGKVNPILPHRQAVAYTVPEGYFDELAGSVLSKIRRGEANFPLKKTRHSMQYAAAAVVAGILIVGAFLLTDNSAYQQADISGGLNKLSENELLKYLGSHEQGAIDPEKEIFATDALPDIKESIRLMSDEELNQYLDESMEPVTAGVAESNG